MAAEQGAGSDAGELRGFFTQRQRRASAFTLCEEAMIDRHARNKLAEEIRHFVECFTDNFQFDDAAWEIKTNDRGVTAVYEAIWLTYDDLTRHKMDGAHALSNEQLAVVKRAIVFLKSDREYRWPRWPLYYRVARPFLWMISFGVIAKRLDKHFHGNGDDEVWPFFTVEEYQMALKSPRYLKGAHNTALQPTPGGDAPCLG